MITVGSDLRVAAVKPVGGLSGLAALRGPQPKHFAMAIAPRDQTLRQIARFRWLAASPGLRRPVWRLPSPFSAGQWKRTAILVASPAGRGRASPAASSLPTASLSISPGRGASASAPASPVVTSPCATTATKLLWKPCAGAWFLGARYPLFSKHFRGLVAHPGAEAEALVAWAVHPSQGGVDVHGVFPLVRAWRQPGASRRTGPLVAMQLLVIARTAASVALGRGSLQLILALPRSLQNARLPESSRARFHPPRAGRCRCCPTRVRTKGFASRAAAGGRRRSTTTRSASSSPLRAAASRRFVVQPVTQVHQTLAKRPSYSTP